MIASVLPGSNIQVCLGFPREKRENEEFADEEFLTRKTDEENEEFISLKYKLLWYFWEAF